MFKGLQGEHKEMGFKSRVICEGQVYAAGR